MAAFCKLRCSTYVALFFVSIRFILFPHVAGADTKGDVISALKEGVELSSDLKEKMNAFAEPMETLTDTYAQLADALVGDKHPAKPSTPYSVDDLISKIDNLASKLEATQPPPISDTSSYSVSIDLLMSCSTQDEALKRLHAYADGMDQVISDGLDNLQYAQQYGTAVNAVYANLVKLNKAFGTLASSPAVDGFFVGKWSETNDVIAVVSHLQNGNKTRIDRINANVADLRTRANNLRSNLNLLPPQACILVGSWRGTCTMAVSGITSPATISLSKSGYQQEGDFGFVGSSFPGSSPIVSNRQSLMFPFGKNNMARLSGTFDSQFSHFNGGVVISGPYRANYSCKLSGSGG